MPEYAPVGEPACLPACPRVRRIRNGFYIPPTFIIIFASVLLVINTLCLSSDLSSNEHSAKSLLASFVSVFLRFTSAVSYSLPSVCLVISLFNVNRVHVDLTLSVGQSFGIIGLVLRGEEGEERGEGGEEIQQLNTTTRSGWRWMN